LTQKLSALCNFWKLVVSGGATDRHRVMPVSFLLDRLVGPNEVPNLLLKTLMVTPIVFLPVFDRMFLPIR
jgi:hypothetical protein